MESEELIKQAERLIVVVRNSTASITKIEGAQTQLIEFMRTYVGPKSSFFERSKHQAGSLAYRIEYLVAILESFIDYIKAGLHAEISPERRAQLDIVSDFLEQANSLLESHDVHPAAPSILIGSTLEEFLRTWIEAEGLSLGNKKPGIDNYAKILREADIITKQDVKDITAWAGIRNHAAHGEWNEVSDRQRIRLMLEGVNLFMRKYGV